MFFMNSLMSKSQLIEQKVGPLYYSERSPFARRIRLALHLREIEFEPRVVNVFDPPADLLEQNPMGMVPVLILNQKPIFDSNLILETLSDHGLKIWSDEVELRLQERLFSTLAAGVMNSAVLYFQETKMHTSPSQEWVEDHQDTLIRSLKELALRFKQNSDHTKQLPHQNAIDLICALDYVDLRLPHLRQDYPDCFMAFESFQKSMNENIWVRHTHPPK